MRDGFENIKKILLELSYRDIILMHVDGDQNIFEFNLKFLEMK